MNFRRIKYALTIITITCSMQSFGQQTLPKFNLLTLQGDTVSSESLAGKNVYFNIWETWCGSCLMEFPILNYAQKELEDVIFLSITPAQKSKVISTLQKRELQITVISDAKEFCKQLGVSGYPTHFFLNAEGIFTEFDVVLGVTRTRDLNQKKLKKLKKAEFEKLLYLQNKNEFVSKIKSLMSS